MKGRNVTLGEKPRYMSEGNALGMVEADERTGRKDSHQINEPCQPRMSDYRIWNGHDGGMTFAWMANGNALLPYPIPRPLASHPLLYPNWRLGCLSRGEGWLRFRSEIQHFG
jgi:hypothetical protein